MTVVLLVLIGLAGLLIPYVSGFMEKTHDSTSVATIAELNNTIQRHQTAKMTLPSNLESLLDATAGTPYSKLQQTAYLTTLTTAAAADAGDLAQASLYKAGVKAIFNNDNATTDATFQSTTGSAVALDKTAFDITTVGPKLAILQGNANNGDQSFFGQLSSSLQSAGKSTAAKNQLANQLIYAFGGNENTWDTTCTNYVVMGIGSASTLVPGSMQSAPVVFGNSGSEAPKDVYARYVSVYAVPSNSTGTCVSDAASVTAPTPDAAARFVGAGAVMSFPALVGLNGAQQWTNNNLAKN